MPRHALIILAVILAAAPSAALAATPECTGGVEFDELTGKCLGEEYKPNQPPAPDPPRCQWRRASMADLRRITRIDPNVQIGDGWFYVSAPGGAVRRQGDTVEVAYIAHSCERGAPNDENDLQWRGEITVDDLIALVEESARRQIETPQMFINPPNRGIVNLGMWLAVSNADPITLSLGNPATGPWVEVNATLTTSTWDMGNGDTVTCDGPGVEIHPDDPGWDSTDEGPCGYTYRDRQAAYGTDTYTITATAIWTVTWLASDGRTNPTPADTIVVANTTTYDVTEILTVGTSG